MSTRLLFCVLALCLSSCQNNEKNFYRTHPADLQKAFRQCPNKAPSNVSCEELSLFVDEVNQLGQELQQNPQEFGQKIIGLQNQLAKLEEELKATKSKDKAEALQKEIDALKERLSVHLGIVKWLESPRA